MTRADAMATVFAFGFICLLGTNRAQTEYSPLNGTAMPIATVDSKPTTMGADVVAVDEPFDRDALRAAQAESISPDSSRWQLGPQAKVSDYLGRRCLNLEDDVAMLKDFEMADGTIDVDMAGNGSRGFYNMLFRTQADRDGEIVYLRPHKTGLADAQQYTPVLNGTGPWQIYNGPGFTGIPEMRCAVQRGPLIFRKTFGFMFDCW
jgi:hypothetical protein